MREERRRRMNETSARWRRVREREEAALQEAAKNQDDMRRNIIERSTRNVGRRRPWRDGGSGSGTRFSALTASPFRRRCYRG